MKKGQASDVEGLSHRKMMGEYLICLDGKIIRGINDDELLLKSNNRLGTLVSDARCGLPYKGSKSLMIIVEPEDPDAVRELIEAARPEFKRQSRVACTWQRSTYLHSEHADKGLLRK